VGEALPLAAASCEVLAMAFISHLRCLSVIATDAPQLQVY
jgi:hypothetical protein